MSAAAMTLQSVAEGERRKLDALATLAARRELHVLRGRRALLLRLLAEGEATADDVRAAVELSADINPVCLGSVPGELARAGIVERVGFTMTARPEAHARPVSVWQLRDRAAALAWLTAHPDRPDPLPAEGFAGPTLFELTESGRRGPRGPRPPTPPDVLIVSGGFRQCCNAACLPVRLIKP